MLQVWVVISFPTVFKHKQNARRQSSVPRDLPLYSYRCCLLIQEVLFALCCLFWGGVFVHLFAWNNFVCSSLCETIDDRERWKYLQTVCGFCMLYFVEMLLWLLFLLSLSLLALRMMLISFGAFLTTISLFLTLSLKCFVQIVNSKLFAYLRSV